MCDFPNDQSSSVSLDHLGVVRVDLNSNVQYISGLKGDYYNDVTINPWGITTTEGSCNCPQIYWVANNGTDKICSYYYDGELSETVNMTGGDPTGIVYNSTDDFKSYDIISVSRKGTIEGFRINELGKADDKTTIIYTDKKAVYTGVGISKTKLYVCNFKSGEVETFDENFAPKDPLIDQSLISSGYHAHNVFVGNKWIFVAFAKYNENNCPVGGVGFGYVAIFDLEGSLLYREFNRDPLNAPWGLALRENERYLYVGNHGDGKINIFDLKYLKYIGPLKDIHCNPVTVGNLWGLFKCVNQLTFTSGMDLESCSEPSNGLIGYFKYCLKV